MKVGSRQAALLALLFTLAGCDWTLSVNVSQALPTPAPAAACVDRALRTVPSVNVLDSTSASIVAGSYWITVRDTTDTLPAEPAMVGLSRIEHRDSVALVVKFRRGVGPPGKVSQQDAQQLARLGAKVIDVVRAVCAPSVSAAVTCRVDAGRGGSRACEAAP